MAENSESVKTVQSDQTEIGLFPFLVAGLICFSIAVLLGSSTWFLFGSNKLKIAPIVEVPTSTPNLITIQNEPVSVASQPQAPAKMELTGLVAVPGGEIALGGGDTKQPLQRVMINDFSISATEVTNAEYAIFVQDTKHSAPQDWRKANFAAGRANYPVGYVSFQDALAYCAWLEKKSGLLVRLPTEAEWEFAARGTENVKYPWGNDWNPKNAVSKETGGKISAVKSFSENRSSVGAFDMTGNVWEWTQEKVSGKNVLSDEAVEAAVKKGQVLRVVKGGSAQSQAREFSIQMRYEIPENTRVPTVGFRYVVEQKTGG